MPDTPPSRLVTLAGVRRLADHHGLTLPDLCREVRELTGRMPSPKRLGAYQERMGNLGTQAHCLFVLVFTRVFPTPSAVLEEALAA